MLLFALFGLAAGCAKEEVRGVGQQISEGTIEMRTEGDCRCEVRINSIDNFPELQNWDIISFPGMDGIIGGVGQNWAPIGGGPLMPLPSDFIPLPDPSSGFQSWLINIAPTPVPSNLSINMTINCYEENDDGSETLANSRTFNLPWKNGTPYPGAPGIGSKMFDLYLDCQKGPDYH